MPKEVELVPLPGGLAASWVMTGGPHHCPSDEALPQRQLCCDFPWCQQDTMRGVMLEQAPLSYRWPWDGSGGEKTKDVRISTWSLWGWQSNPTGYCHLFPSSLLPGITSVSPCTGYQTTDVCLNIMLRVWLISLAQAIGYYSPCTSANQGRKYFPHLFYSFP